MSAKPIGRLRPVRSDSPTALVSVVVPCFNYARYLSDAVESVLAQEGVGVEVIIVDDASTDESMCVARTLADSDARVSVISHPVNMGPVATFNDGLEVATGEFLVRLDADDMLTPGSLSRSLAVCGACPTVGLVYGRPLHFSDHVPHPRLRPRRWTVWRGDDWLADRCADGYNVITSPEAFMRMSVVRQVGGQQPLAHTHDMEMWLRIAAFADVAYVHGADQAWHREHNLSLSAREVDVMMDLRERVAAFRELASGVARTRPRVAENVVVALRSLASEAVELAIVDLKRGDSRPERIAELIAIALEADPDIMATPQWARLDRSAIKGPSPRVVALAKRAQRRLQWYRRRRHWRRTGTWT